MPRSGSTYDSLGAAFLPTPPAGTIWGRSRAEASGERLTAVARLLSVTRRERGATLNTYAHLFEQAAHADQLREGFSSSYGYLLRRSG